MRILFRQIGRMRKQILRVCHAVLIVSLLPGRLVADEREEMIDASIQRATMWLAEEQLPSGAWR